MRHGAAGRRSRNRGNGGRRGGHGGGGGHNRMQVFDSNGPDVRIRGTAYQILEKYLALAKDAAAAGDRILSESYLQHAEHYQRTINIWQEANPHYSHPQQQQHQHTDQPQVQQQAAGGGGEDLSLPASILGAAPVAKAELEAV